MLLFEALIALFFGTNVVFSIFIETIEASHFEIFMNLVFKENELTFGA